MLLIIILFCWIDKKRKFWKICCSECLDTRIKSCLNKDNYKKLIISIATPDPNQTNTIDKFSEISHYI